MKCTIFTNVVWLGFLGTYYNLYSMEVALSRYNNSNVIEQLGQLMLTDPSKAASLLRAGTIKANEDDSLSKTLFSSAVEKGDAKILEHILTHTQIRDFISEQEQASSTCLYWYDMVTAMQNAAKQGNKEIVDLLYKYTVGDKDMMCRLALIAATEHYHDVEIMKHLLRYMRLDIEKYAIDRTLLHRALTRGLAQLFAILLAHADKVHEEFGAFLLMEAIQKGDRSIIESLLLKGISVNSRDYRNATALPIAIFHGLIDMCVLHSTEINLKLSKGGITALMMAVHEKKTDLIERLLAAGAQVNDSDGDGRSVLHMAVFSKNVESVRLLVEHKVDFEKRDKNGLTPLHYAFVIEGCANIGELLLKRGASINALFSMEGLSVPVTLLQYKSARGDAQVVKMLLLYKADVRAKLADTLTTGGETALHLAASSGHADVCRLLLEYGSDLHAKTTSGWMLGGKTPLDMATGRAKDFLARYQERSQSRDGEK